MHPREIARQSGEASARINDAARQIGAILKLDPPDFDHISPRGGPDVKRLRERQIQAEYLEAIAARLGEPVLQVMKDYTLSEAVTESEEPEMVLQAAPVDPEDEGEAALARLLADAPLPEPEMAGVKA